MSALHIGRPLPGQRVTDLLLLLDHLQSDPSFGKPAVEITASGMTALVSLHAKVLDERIKRIYITRYPHSFMDLIHNIQQKDNYSYVIPGVLQYYDIPDLLRASSVVTDHTSDFGMGSSLHKSGVPKHQQSKEK